MVELEKIEDKEIAAFINKKIKERIDKFWLKDILIQKEFHVHHHLRETDISGFVERFIWDNLTEEQKEKVIQAINLLIEEDILIDKQPFGNYCFDLLDLAVRLENKMPGKINSKPFLIWKEKNFFNLPNPEKTDSPLRIELTEKIKRAFGK